MPNALERARRFARMFGRGASKTCKKMGLTVEEIAKLASQRSEYERARTDAHAPEPPLRRGGAEAAPIREGFGGGQMVAPSIAHRVNSRRPISTTQRRFGELEARVPFQPEENSPKQSTFVVMPTSMVARTTD